jgi:hypothetical protein
MYMMKFVIGKGIFKRLTEIFSGKSEANASSE